MSKIHKVIQTTHFKANEVIDKCIHLYNEERVIADIHITLTLDELKLSHLTVGTKKTVINILRGKGFEAVRYDNLTRTFRGYLSSPNVVLGSSNTPLKPIKLNIPTLRTAMGDVYRYNPN